MSSLGDRVTGSSPASLSSDAGRGMTELVLKTADIPEHASPILHTFCGSCKTKIPDLLSLVENHWDARERGSLIFQADLCGDLEKIIASAYSDMYYTRQNLLSELEVIKSKWKESIATQQPGSQLQVYCDPDSGTVTSTGLYGSLLSQHRTHALLVYVQSTVLPRPSSDPMPMPSLNETLGFETFIDSDPLMNSALHS